MSDEQKQGGNGLIFFDPSKQGGKYLVLRRDGTVLDGPYFVLGCRDKAAPAALREYVRIWERWGSVGTQYNIDVLQIAGMMERARAKLGTDAPANRGERVDNPRVIEQMMNPDRVILAAQDGTDAALAEIVDKCKSGLSTVIAADLLESLYRISEIAQAEIARRKGGV